MIHLAIIRSNPADSFKYTLQFLPPMNPVKNAKLFAALALVFSVALVPATAAYAQETDANVDQTRDQIKDQIRDIKSDTRDAIKQLKDERAEKLRQLKDSLPDQYKDRIRTTDGQIRPDVIPDREPDVKFDAEANGWMLINGVAHESSTIIESGYAYHIKNGLWKLKVDDAHFSVGDRDVTLDLVGKAKGHRMMLYGTGVLSTNDDGTENQIRVMLRGHFAPTSETGHFAIAFTQFGFHTMDNGKKLPLIQVGNATVYPNVNAENPASFDVPATTDLEIFN